MVESDKVNAATSAAVSCVWSAIHLPMRLVSAYHLRSGGCPKSSEQLDRFQNEAARLYGIMATVYGRFVAAFSPELSRQIENAVLCVQGSYDPPRYFNQVGATWHEAVLKGTHAVLCLPLFQADVFDHRFDCLDDRIRERDFSGLEAALKAVDGEDRSAFWRRVVDEARPTVTEMGDPDFVEAKLKWESARALADTPATAIGLVASTEEQGWVSCSDLATKHTVSADALRKRLERWRHKHDDGWMEVSETERKTRDARFLYRESAVSEVIRNILSR